MTGLTQALDSLSRARRKTLLLCQDLSENALREQVDQEFSPIGWHLGHIAWQEECWLQRNLGKMPPLDPERDSLWNSFASEKNQRGPGLPSKDELWSYLHAVRERTLSLCQVLDVSLRTIELFHFIANHERQHTEIMGTVRWLGKLPLEPQTSRAQPKEDTQPQELDTQFCTMPGGEFLMGSPPDDLDAWDNERPLQRVKVADFELMRFPVSNRSWLEFMLHGGYRERALWDEAGWAWRCSHDVKCPLGWLEDKDGGWQLWTLHGFERVEPRKPVCHVSWFEARAYARFMGARLPSEAEWEFAASHSPAGKRRTPWGDNANGNHVANWDLQHWDVTKLGTLPASASYFGAEQLIGDVWEWTCDEFSAYPGFTPQAYAGYSAPFFDGRHQVARGGSFLTQPEIARPSFRTWYTPDQRQPVLGVRLARG